MVVVVAAGHDGPHSNALDLITKVRFVLTAASTSSYGVVSLLRSAPEPTLQQNWVSLLQSLLAVLCEAVSVWAYICIFRRCWTRSCVGVTRAKTHHPIFRFLSCSSRRSSSRKFDSEVLALAKVSLTVDSGRFVPQLNKRSRVRLYCINDYSSFCYSAIIRQYYNSRP